MRLDPIDRVIFSTLANHEASIIRLSKTFSKTTRHLCKSVNMIGVGVLVLEVAHAVIFRSMIDEIDTLNKEVKELSSNSKFTTNYYNCFNKDEADEETE